MQWFHPVRGPGRTEKEATVRGMEGALMQLLRRRSLQTSTPAFLAVLSKPGVPPAPSGPQSAGNFPSADGVCEKWGFGEWQPPPLQITQQPEQCAFSTGAFIDPRRGQVLPCKDRISLRDQAFGVAKEAETHWHSAQAADNAVYQLWRSAQLLRPGSGSSSTAPALRTPRINAHDVPTSPGSAATTPTTPFIAEQSSSYSTSGPTT